MKKILLALGYIAGVLVGTRFGEKTEVKSTKKTAKKSDETMADKAMEAGKDFVDAHKKAYSELKKEYWTEENKKLILSKKKDLEKFFDLVKDEFAEAQVVLKKHGVDTKAMKGKIESIYEERKDFLETLGKTPTARKAKKKLSDIVRKIRKKI
jgi:hypothetical protein